MKKIYLFIFTACIISTGVIAQPTVFYTNLTSATTPALSNSRMALTDLGAFRQCRFQTNAAPAPATLTYAFHIGSTAAPDYNANWRPYTPADATGIAYALNTVTVPSATVNSARYNSFSGGTDGNLAALATATYYTVNTQENAGSDNLSAIWGTSFNPVTFSGVVQAPLAGAVNPGNLVTVTFNASVAPNASEFVYVRYSTNGFATSSIVQAGFVTTVGTAFIPAQVAGTNLSYYIFSSSRTAAQLAAIVATAGVGEPGYDISTLNLVNNSGANYSYTVNAGTNPVTVNATAGTATADYADLNSAFNSINAGTHQGTITVSIKANTAEGVNPATLNSSGAGAANYTSILLRPLADGLSVSGFPVTGFGVIQLNGADNVTIDGDNPNTSGTNRNLTVNNTTTNTVIANSCIRIATSAAVTNADNITIKNCVLNGNVTAGNTSAITSATGSSNSSFGIYCGGNGGATATGLPTAITSVTTNTAPSGTTINALVIDNNIVNQCARAIVFNGALNTVSTGVTITNNLIGDQATTLSGLPPYITSATTVYTKGIYIAGTNAIVITGNTLKNILSYVATTMTAIELNTAIGTGIININNNTVNGVVNNGTSNGSNGIIVSNAGGNYSVSGNIVTNIQAVGSVTVTGAITISGGAAVTALVEKNNVSMVYSRGAATSGSYGINITNGINHIIRNNFVSDINHNMTAPSYSTTTGVFGIRIAGGTGHKLYHNSVNLAGLSPGTAAASHLTAALCISVTTITGLDIRNNIFSNTISGGTTNPAHVAVFLPSGATNAMNLVMNNNAYFVSPAQGVAQVGTTAGTGFYTASNFTNSAPNPATNLRSYTATLLPGNFGNDSASKVFTTAAPFVSSTDLHINTGVTPTQLESGGAALGVATDYDGQSRPGPTALNGGGTAPDLGADEFDGVPRDELSPVINYIPFPFTCSLGDRVVTGINITDATGVPISGLLVPRIYYKKGAGGTWFSQPGTLSSGTNMNGQWSFTIVAADMGGLVGTDQVFYYIIAQDVAAIPNIGSNSGGVVATNVNTITTPPASTGSYTFTNALSGTYTVGVAGTYPSLTAAITAYNISCLSGPVVFSLIDLTYNEAYPAILANPYAGSATTLTIKPAPGVGTVLTGSAATILKLNGADYVIIDGSNNGTGSRDLTITTTNTTATGTLVWLGSASATDGAGNDTVRNCILTGNATNLNTIAGIITGSGTTAGNAAEAPNSNNGFINNLITRVKDGIALVGFTTGDQNMYVSSNFIGSPVTGNRPQRRGIWASTQQNFTISGNTLNSMGNASAGLLAANAIFVDGNSLNGTISRNIINDIKCDQQVAVGVDLRSASTAANITVSNNFISNIYTDGATGASINNSYGILLNAGGGYQIYHNTINLTQAQTVAFSISAPVFINNTITAPASVDLRNNLLINNQVSGANLRYALYSLAPANVFSNIDYNDYYVNSGGFLGFINNSDQANIANLQSSFSGNTNSVSMLPVFVSSTDMHLDAAGSAALNNLGTPLAAVAVDIDNQARSLTKPDMGADEFTPANCTGANGGTAAFVTSMPICISGAVNAAASGFSAGNQTSYTWQSSSDNFVADINDIPGANNPLNLSAAPITQNTYYRLKVFCAAAGLTGYSTIILATINNPAIITITPGGRCGTGTVTMGAGTSAGSIPAWYAAPSGGSPLAISSSFTTPSLSSSTNYYVSAVSSGAANNLQVGIGANTTNQSYGGSPYVNQGGSAVSLKTQYIIRASELAAAGIAPGPINSVSLDIAANGGFSYTNFEVQIGGTAQTIALPTFVTGLTSVFTSASHTVPTLGLVNYPFSAPFNWDGVSNIALQFCWTATGGGGTTVKFTDPGFDYATYFADGSAGTACVQTTGTVRTTGTTNIGRPKFVFNASSRCESNRLPFTATISTPPAIPVLAGSPGSGAVCQNEVVGAGRDYRETNCNLIATITPSGAFPVVGNINTCVTVDTGANKLGTAFNYNRLFVARHYAIEPSFSAFSTTGTVKLYFKQSEFDNYNSKALDSGYYPLPNNGAFTADSLRVFQFHGTPAGLSLPNNYFGAVEQLAQPQGVTTVWNATNSLWEVTVPANGFSGFFISTKSRGALPVKIEYFRGTRLAGSHLLDWKLTPVNTTTGIITLERSMDSRNFTGIYAVTATALRMLQPFSYTDSRPMAGINYYRLKLVDDKGVITYSNILALLNASKGKEILNISPNPVTEGRFTLNITSAEMAKMRITIADIAGRVVARQDAILIAGFNAIEINVSNLAKGTYQIFGNSEDGSTRVLQFVKQ
jgi:hypothetical protein